MAIPNIFQKNLAGSGGSSIIGSVPALIAGGQMTTYLFSTDGFTNPERYGALAEIAAKSTIFKGRFLDDIFVLLFTKPSPLGVLNSAVSVGLSTPLIRGVRLNSIAAALPNFFAFVFRINPTVHQRTQTRARQTTLTKGGYLTQYWSAGMKVMTFEGSSGPLVPPTHELDKENFNIRQTAGYANFLQLRKFYEEANQDVGILFLGRFLLGVMSDFSFTEDANNPYEIKYSFKFEAYPEHTELG